MCKRSEMRRATESERKALGVPPAYTDVMIAVDPKAELIATAKTKAGKTFYKYSQAFVEKQQDAKWARVRKLGRSVEKVVARIEKDSVSGPQRDVAMTARLILLTGMRNGGAPQGETESFGASSLLLKHVTLDGNTMRFQFPGKKAVPQDVVVTDAVLAGYVRERTVERQLFPHDASATLRYMKSVGARKVHDLRTWKANELATALLEELLANGERPKTKKEVKQLQKAIASRVAETLGNTPSVAMKSYIDPRVWTPLER
jgi:DNA topoisomerase-1